MEYTFDDFEKLIMTKSECNFIALAITPYQAIGVSAAIAFLQNKGIRLCGYILMTAHELTGNKLKEEHFSIRPDSVSCLRFDYNKRENKSILNKLRIKTGTIKTGLSSYKKPDRTIYFVCTECTKDILYLIGKGFPNSRIVFVKIDDGFGSYNGPFAQRLSLTLFKLGKKYYKFPLAYLRTALYSSFIKIIEYNFNKNGCMYNGEIFTRSIDKGKELQPNSEFVPFYNLALQEFDVPKENFEKYENAVVINSQPLKEVKITDGVVDFNSYKRLISILQKHDVKALIKPHPREDNISRYDKLGCAVDKLNGSSQEIILAQIVNKPICIIGIYSSTLLNAYGLFSIPAISIAKILKKENISKAFSNELDKYIRMYKDIIVFPEDYNDFEETIKNIIATKNRNNQNQVLV